MKALVVGHAEPAGALTSALSEAGIEAELYAPPRPAPEEAVRELARALVELEERLADYRGGLAIVVGLGDAPLAAAMVATKLGVPLVAWVEDSNGAGDELERAQRRILEQLADLDAGPVGDGPAAFEAARLIVSWAT